MRWLCRLIARQMHAANGSYPHPRLAAWVRRAAVSVSGESPKVAPAVAPLPAAIRVTLRNQFRVSNTARLGMTTVEEWATQIAKRRIEHDRDRAKHIEHADWQPLGPPKYVESGPTDDPCGEWFSDFCLLPAPIE